MKYIKLFENHTEYETFESGGTMVKPNVSHCVQENEVHYNPKTWADEYLTFDILSSGIINWKSTGYTSSEIPIISYKINNSDWTETTSSIAGTSFNVSAGDKVRFKGNNATYGKFTTDYNTFSGSTASFDIKGNIMSLISGDSFAKATTLESAYTFISLFSNTNVVSAENLLLPATTLANNCYNNMFYGCTSLTTAPQLPSTILTRECYDNMFYGCTNLTTAPKLPATTLVAQCYDGMFRDCTNLVNAPELPATTLADTCYNNMFRGCTSLTAAPELPATTLASGCYQYMFNGCTSLTTAPELPATTLAQRCYYSMFYGCRSLNYIKCLATDISATSCTRNWVTYVAETGTFVKNAAMSDWLTGIHGIPEDWTLQDATE